jgi:hypothetical protein
MAEAERAFLLLAGHMQNELNSLNKVFGWCLHNPRSDHTSPIEGLANGMQAMLYARVLAGKLCEAWDVLGTAFFGTKLSQRVESKLHPTAQDSLKRIKLYFSKTNVIHRVRNSFSFHYSVEEFNSNWNEALDEPTFEIVLGGTVGNNLHLAAEIVANTALLNGINSNDKADALRIFFNDVQSVASSFTNFLEGTIMAILEEQLGSGLTTLGREEEIFPTRSYNEVAIPFFCKPDASQ